jgi:hypothetical protein
MRVAVPLIPFRCLVRALRLQAGEGTSETGAVGSHRAIRVGWAIAAAGARAPWHSTCLMRALAAAALLQRRQLSGTLYLGVARDGSQGLNAHAWLQRGDLVLTGAAERDGFTAVGTYRF